MFINQFNMTKITPLKVKRTRKLDETSTASIFVIQRSSQVSQIKLQLHKSRFNFKINQ
jgi:hypothetical protein